MNRLEGTRQAQVVRCLVEGNSIRATVRMSGAAKNTVTKLLVELGGACARYQSEVLRGLRCECLRLETVHSFVYARQENVTAAMVERRVAGDVWTFTAMDSDTRLVPVWMVGPCDAETALAFLTDVAARLSHGFDLREDGGKPVLKIGRKVQPETADLRLLLKLADASRSEAPPGPRPLAAPADSRPSPVLLQLAPRLAPHSEAFSKKLANLEAALALHFMWHNFSRFRPSSKTTPAMAVGVANHLWTVEEMLALRG